MDENVSVKDVYKGLVEYLRNNTEELVKLSEFIKTPEQFLSVVMWYKLDDHVYEKFGLENEDVLAIERKNYTDLFNDPEVGEIMANFKDLIADLENKVRSAAKQRK